MNLVTNSAGLLFEVGDADLDRFLANGWKAVEPAATAQEEEQPKPKRTTKKK